MPPVDVPRHTSEPVDVKGLHDRFSSVETANAPSAFTNRDKESATAGGFENIMNGRYSGIGRGGSVGDELVRAAAACVSFLPDVTVTGQARLRRELHAEQVEAYTRTLHAGA